MAEGLWGQCWTGLSPSGFPTVESRDYVNVPESEESAEASLGKWLGAPRALPPARSPSVWLCCGMAMSPLTVSPDGSLEYVNVSQELQPLPGTEPGVYRWGDEAGGPACAAACRLPPMSAPLQPP